MRRRLVVLVLLGAGRLPSSWPFLSLCQCTCCERASGPCCAASTLQSYGAKCLHFCSVCSLRQSRSRSTAVACTAAAKHFLVGYMSLANRGGARAVEASSCRPALRARYGEDAVDYCQPHYETAPIARRQKPFNYLNCQTGPQCDQYRAP